MSRWLQHVKAYTPIDDNSSINCMYIYWPRPPTVFYVKNYEEGVLAILGVMCAKFNLMCNGNYAQNRISKLHNYEGIVPTCLMIHVWI
jgi:hypothetical protein